MRWKKKKKKKRMKWMKKKKKKKRWEMHCIRVEIEKRGMKRMERRKGW